MPTAASPTDDADLERRFAGVRRLYGDAAFARFGAARACVVGIGGVGSWAVEALARSAVGALTLIDLDMVAESNVNRQIHALSGAFGAAKVDAMALRIEAINPACRVTRVEDFVTAGNVAALLGGDQTNAANVGFDVIVDAIDDAPAKVALLATARRLGVPLVTVGGAGGRVDPTQITVDDLALSTHDPLLARVRRELRRDHGFPARGPFGIRAVFSREAMREPSGEAPSCAGGGRLSCVGYGSAVTVTASFGLAAAAEALALLAG